MSSETFDLIYRGLRTPQQATQLIAIFRRLYPQADKAQLARYLKSEQLTLRRHLPQARAEQMQQRITAAGGHCELIRTAPPVTAQPILPAESSPPATDVVVQTEPPAPPHHPPARPEHPPPGRLVSPLRRMFALLIDLLFVAGTLLILLYVADLIGMWEPIFSDLMQLFALIHLLLVTSTLPGGGLGGWLLHQRLVNREGAVVSPLWQLLRALTFLLTLPLLALPLLSILWHRQRRGIHDIVSGVWVVASEQGVGQLPLHLSDRQQRRLIANSRAIAASSCYRLQPVLQQLQQKLPLLAQGGYRLEAIESQLTLPPQLHLSFTRHPTPTAVEVLDEQLRDTPLIALLVALLQIAEQSQQPEVLLPHHSATITLTHPPTITLRQQRTGVTAHG